MNTPCRVTLDENKYYLDSEFEDDDFDCEDLGLLDDIEEEE